MRSAFLLAALGAMVLVLTLAGAAGCRDGGAELGTPRRFGPGGRFVVTFPAAMGEPAVQLQTVQRAGSDSLGGFAAETDVQTLSAMGVDGAIWAAVSQPSGTTGDVATLVAELDSAAARAVARLGDGAVLVGQPTTLGSDSNSNSGRRGREYRFRAGSQRTPLYGRLRLLLTAAESAPTAAVPPAAVPPAAVPPAAVPPAAESPAAQRHIVQLAAVSPSQRWLEGTEAVGFLESFAVRPSPTPMARDAAPTLGEMPLPPETKAD